MTTTSLRFAGAFTVLLLTGCQARVASYGKVDVCSVVVPILSAQAGTVISSRALSSDGLAGSCTIEFEGNGRRGQISFTLFTTASTAATQQDLDAVARITLAEAQQVYGQPPSNLLQDLARTNAFFALAGQFEQALLLDRGALLDVGTGGSVFSQEQGDRIVRSAWKALLDYRPPKTWRPGLQ